MRSVGQGGAVMALAVVTAFVAAAMTTAESAFRRGVGLGVGVAVAGLVLNVVPLLGFGPGGRTAGTLSRGLGGAFSQAGGHPREQGGPV